MSSSGTYPVDVHALERPDLIRGAPRSVNMSAIGDALTAAAPPVRAIFVYNSNPVAVAPDSGKVARGFAREDLFCVVHDLFRTDRLHAHRLRVPALCQPAAWADAYGDTDADRDAHPDRHAHSPR